MTAAHRICEEFGWSLYDLPQPFRDNLSLSPYKCPNQCEYKAMWRRGQEFDHMMICPTCDEVWTPGIVEMLHELVAEEITNVSGDGI